MHLKQSYYNNIFFDLDGTLIDSSASIIEGFQHTLTKLGISPPAISMKSIIGPPIAEGFKKILPLPFQTEVFIKHAVQIFREYYAIHGIEKNMLYPGIPLLLQTLKNKNKKMAIATSKPTVFAKQILEQLNIAHYFDVIIGTELSTTTHEKKEILAKALIELSIADSSQSVMIGDRMYDLIAAHENKIDAIGVLYGFGSANELKSYSPTFLANDAQHLEKILI